MRLGAVVTLSLLVATPALAQMNFEGLDLGGKKKKKKEEKKKEEKKEKEEGGSNEVKMPEGGLDLTKPPEKEEKSRGNAPTMSFEGVDVSGKAADRQKLDAAVREFKDESYELAALHSYDLMQDPKMAGLQTE